MQHTFSGSFNSQVCEHVSRLPVKAGKLLERTDKLKNGIPFLHFYYLISFYKPSSNTLQWLSNPLAIAAHMIETSTISLCLQACAV